MASLYEMTDVGYEEPVPSSLPVEPLYQSVPVSSDGMRRVYITKNEVENPVAEIRPEPRPEPGLWDNLGMAGVQDKSGKSESELLKKLFGLGGKERHQLWPEKVVREGLKAAGEVMSTDTLSQLGLRREDLTDIPAPSGPTKDSTWLGKILGVSPVAAQPGDDLIEKAQAVSALAGSGGIGGTGPNVANRAGADVRLFGKRIGKGSDEAMAEVPAVAFGATPSLRPALKYKDRLYKGKEGQQHMDVIPNELYPEFQKMAMSGEDISHYNFGFVNDKGQFLTREKALQYAVDTGLVDKQAGQYGALTSTLMADSSKPGTAIEAVAKTVSPFYSAVEHNVAAIPQSKMTGDQWLGTLSNKPGVKGEELDWTGLKGFLEENKGKPVTKEAIQEHLASNKVELKEIGKGTEFNEARKAKAQELMAKLNELEKDNISKGTFKNTPEMEKIQNELQAVREQSQAVTTKYQSYQLPGATNYREMLLTLPEKANSYNVVYKVNGKRTEANFNSKEEASNFIDKASDSKAAGLDFSDFKVNGRQTDAYKSSHWDEPNILAHVRMNDRTIDGKKSLHVEEIQSDWHQQGRDKGYKSNDPLLKEKAEQARKDYQAILPEIHAMIEKNDNFGYKSMPDAMREMRNKGPDVAFPNASAEQKTMAWKAYDAFNDANNLAKKADVGVPDAPFKKTWHELALKRMIREAAEKGYDRLSWTPGEAQAARYNLSKSIDTVQATKLPDGTYNIHARPINDAGFTNMGSRVPENKLADIVGKELAEKISKQPVDKASSYKGLDLKIGGEGMKGFYDQIIPKALEKLGKEHGVKVKQDFLPKKQYGVYDGNDKLLNAFDTMAEGNAFVNQQPRTRYMKDVMTKQGEPVFYIDIPPSLKDTAMNKGFPLFSNGYMLVSVQHIPDFGDDRK